MIISCDMIPSRKRSHGKRKAHRLKSARWLGISWFPGGCHITSHPKVTGMMVSFFKNKLEEKLGGRKIGAFRYVSKSREKSYGNNTQTAPKQQKQQKRGLSPLRPIDMPGLPWSHIHLLPSVLV